MKYSINSAGNIVAERDIYSLGGFIPKGSVGCKVANGDQISQDGECWVSSGDISARPDVRVEDNAYIGTWNPSSTALHTDVIAEFSGNTLIPGTFLSRCFAADIKNNIFVKDTFIGVTMDVICGPVSTTTAFPFMQGRLDHTKPAGTPTADMAVADANSCFSNTVMRCGEDTQIYVPANVTARVLWVYNNVSNATAYSGEYELLQPGLKKVSHPTYRIAFVVFNSTSALTPAGLSAMGAKILGHVSNSQTVDFRPESVSGSYVMDNSSFIMNTDNFGLAATQLRFLAGGLYNTNMYTKTDRRDYKPYGTFRNVERLEYNQYFGDVHRGNVNRDNYIKASDCPLVRVGEAFVTGTLVNAGGLTLRRCIVPKGRFQNDTINGNTYEDIDFSYANEHLGATVGQGAICVSSHKQGVYAANSNDVTYGYVSKPDNLIGTANMGADFVNIPLDGNIMEQGTYTYTVGGFYEDLKVGNVSRIRTGKPLPTKGITFPSLPSGWKITSLMYLDEGFVIRGAEPTPITKIETNYPYYVMHIGKDPDASEVNVLDFIALGASLRYSNYHKVPEITGSAFIGTGCTVRGDVKLIGDPYVNRVLDRNLWERKALSGNFTNGWESAKIERSQGDRMLTVDLQEIGDRGCTITCESGYYFIGYFFDGEGNYMLNPGWQQSYTVSSSSLARYVGILIKKAEASADNGGLITEDDIPLANVKIVQAFKKIRYITNELDRNSPDNIFLSQDVWRVSSISTGNAYIGRFYDDLIGASSRLYCILKRPINMGSSWTVTQPGGAGNVYTPFNSSWDALTKLLGLGVQANAALTGLEIKKVSGEIVTLLDVPAARLVVEFVPSPRIIIPYGVSGILVQGMCIRMYDNSVLSKNITGPEEMILKGDAVVSHIPAGCVCSWGDYDAIAKP